AGHHVFPAVVGSGEVDYGLLQCGGFHELSVPCFHGIVKYILAITFARLRAGTTDSRSNVASEAAQHDGVFGRAGNGVRRLADLDCTAGGSHRSAEGGPAFAYRLKADPSLESLPPFTV